MRADELRAFGDLTVEAATAVADQARDVHAAVAGRVFGALGPIGSPVRSVHDAVAAASYAGSRSVTGAAVRTAAALVSLAGDPSAPPLAASPRGRVVLGALGGAWGDRLHARGSVLATPPALFVDDHRPPTGRIVVFVHGLGETELSWRPDRPAGYGRTLGARHGLTPVYARYNNGRSIADSAAALSRVLAELVETWPVAVTELSLVGHSLGGLVAQAAGREDHEGVWVPRVRATVSLGSPYEGAPLARLARDGERLLSLIPEVRPFAGPLRARSVVTRELAGRADPGFLAGADHYFVSATITRDPGALAGRVLGDLLVRHRSAWAQSTRAERLRFDPGHYRHLGASDHFDLLAHPAVAQLLEAWLGAARLPAPGLTTDRPRASRR